jgi:hypothetical protein
MKGVGQNHYHRISLPMIQNASAICSVLNSGVFYLYFKSVSNCRNFGDLEIYGFSISKMSPSQLNQLVSLCGQLGNFLRDTTETCTREYP